MAFMTLINSLRKIKVLLNFAPFSLCVHFLAILIEKRLHTTLLAFEEGSTKHILRGRKWLSCLDIVFTQVKIEKMFVVSICCSFLTT